MQAANEDKPRAGAPGSSLHRDRYMKHLADDLVGSGFGPMTDDDRKRHEVEYEALVREDEAKTSKANTPSPLGHLLSRRSFL